MPGEQSVSTLIDGLKQGDPDAAEQLWVRYFDRLAAAARRKLSSIPRRVFDEEDVAISVFDSLCRGAQRGRFKKLTDRHDLWALLLAMTRQKAVDKIRYAMTQKQGGGRLRGESVFVIRGDGSQVLSIEQILAEEPTPELLVEMDDLLHRLLELLPDDSMRRVAVLRMEGSSVKEIATDFGYTTRWAERKLELIRKRWSREMNE